MYCNKHIPWKLMVGKWTFLFKWFFFRIFKGGSIKYYCIYCVCVYISTCICIHSSIRFPASHRQRQELEQMRHKFNSEASQNRRSFREMGGWRGGMCVKLKPHGKWWFLEESCQELCGKKVEICGFVFFWFEEFWKEERRMLWFLLCMETRRVQSRVNHFDNCKEVLCSLASCWLCQY